MMQDLAKSKNNISSNGLFLLVEGISIGVGLLIVFNTLNIVEEYMEGKQVVLNSIEKSPSNALMPPSLLICSQSMLNQKYLLKGDQLTLSIKEVTNFSYMKLILIILILENI